MKSYIRKKFKVYYYQLKYWIGSKICKKKGHIWSDGIGCNIDLGERKPLGYCHRCGSIVVDNID